MRGYKKANAVIAFVTALVFVMAAPMAAFGSQTSLGKATENSNLFYGIGDEVIFNMMIGNPDPVQSNIYKFIRDGFFKTPTGNAEVWIANSSFVDQSMLVENTDYLVDGNNMILRWNETTFPGHGSNTITLGVGESSYRNVHYTIAEEDFGKELNNTLLVQGTNTAGSNFSSEVEKAIHVVGLRINIAPSEYTNPVGDTHTLTAKVEVNWAGADNRETTAGGVGVWEPAPAGTLVDFTLTGPGFFDEDWDGISDDGLAVPVDVNGEAVIDLISENPGLSQVHAETEYVFTSTIEDPAAPAYTASAITDGLRGNSEDAIKHWVDAMITISPSGINLINDTHYFTAQMLVDNGDGEGFVPAPDDTLITFEIENGPGSFVETSGTADDGIVAISGGNGEAQTGLTSTTSGITEVSASGSITIAEATLNVTTDGIAPNSGNAEKTWISPDIHIEKTVDFNGDATFNDSETYYAGESADYKYLVTLGSSSDPLSEIAVVDDQSGVTPTIYSKTGGDDDEFLEVDETWEFHAYGITIDAPFLNTATASGIDQLDNTVTDADTAEVLIMSPAIDIVKTVDFDGDGVFNDSETYYASNTAIYRYVVTYDGSDVPIDNIHLTDDQGLTPLLDATESNGEEDGILGNGETWVYYASTIISDDVTNVGTVTGDDPIDNQVTATDEAIVLVISPDISIVKTVDFDGDGVFTDLEMNTPGSMADYKYVVTFGESDVPIDNIQVTDDQGVTPVLNADESNGEENGILEAGETWIYYANDVVINTDTTNIGTVTGDDPLDNEVTDNDDARVEITAEFEGLTPGFWKNHEEAWEGFTIGQTLEEVFDVPDTYALDGTTLMGALNFGGGKGDVGAAKILFRAAVAALLNAEHPDINYEFEKAEIITAVNQALLDGRAAMLTLASEYDQANNAGADI